MTKPKPKFSKIIEVDDWGCVGYYLKAKKSKAGTWSHESQDQSYRLKNGDKVEVLWPDKTVTAATCKIVPTTTTISDWGHDYTVPSEVLYFTLKKFNATIRFVDISEIRVRRVGS